MHTRPGNDETFDLVATYEHIDDWNKKVQHECDELRWQENFDGGNEGGLGLRMRSWPEEAAKRILRSSGFALLRYDEMFDTENEDSDARALWTRSDFDCVTFWYYEVQVQTCAEVIEKGRENRIPEFEDSAGVEVQ